MADFIPFRACHLRNEPGGYVEIHLKEFGPVWARIEEPVEAELLVTGDCVVTIFGWGEPPIVLLRDLSLEDARKLIATVEAADQPPPLLKRSASAR